MAKTRTVSIRHFRENMTKFLREGQDKNIHFVVMRHDVPIAKVSPVKRDASLESLIAQVAEARKAYKEGRTFTTEQVRKMLGI